MAAGLTRRPFPGLLRFNCPCVISQTTRKIFQFLQKECPSFSNNNYQFIDLTTPTDLMDWKSGTESGKYWKPFYSH